MERPFSLRAEAKRFLIYDIDQPIGKTCRGCKKVISNIGELVEHEQKCQEIIEGISNPTSNSCYRLENCNYPMENNFKEILVRHEKLESYVKSIMEENKELRTALALGSANSYPIDSDMDIKDNLINMQKQEIKKLRESKDKSILHTSNDRELMEAKVEMINELRAHGATYYKECCRILDNNTNIESIREGVNACDVLIGTLNNYKENSKDAYIVLKILQCSKTLDEEFKFSIKNHYNKALIKLRAEIVETSDKQAIDNILRSFINI